MKIATAIFAGTLANFQHLTWLIPKSQRCTSSNMLLQLFWQNIDPARRRRRDIWVNNSTLGDPVRVLKTFRVITPDDLEEAVSASTVVNVGTGWYLFSCIVQ
jgi:hypothetical protein